MKYYGRYPSKKKIQNALEGMKIMGHATNSVNLQLTQKEIEYLLKLIMADLHRMDKEMDHAICYGAVVVLPDRDLADNARKELLEFYHSA